MVKPRKEIQEMKPYDPPLEGREGKLRLDFNENTVGPSPKVIEALREISAEAVCSYPEYFGLREKIAQYAGVKGENIAVLNGSDEAIRNIMDFFLEKGDTIVLPVPTFVMFGFYAQALGMKVKKIPYMGDLGFPVNEVIDAIGAGAKLAVLVNPNNPTGTVIERNDLVKIIRKCKENDAIALVDEAYYEFFGETAVDLINEFDNLVVLRTFSKAFGLAGLRAGYAVSCRENIEAIRKASSPYSVNALAVTAIKAALADLNYMKRYVGEVKRERERVLKEFMEMKIKVFPTNANFFVARIGNDAKRLVKGLSEEKILVRDRSDYTLLEGCVRFGIGIKEQNDRLIKKTREILGK
ncbi:MAG: histidinol-phosphate transaminase [Candidatus Diapherotrites archaeon]